MFRKEKKCKNPECESVIEYFENPKKIFCNASCKNRFHYLSDREKNHEVYEFEKALKTNYEIASNFFKQNIFEVDAEVPKHSDLKEVFTWVLNNFHQVKNCIIR